LLAAPLQRAVDDPGDVELAGGAQRILVIAGIAPHRAGRANHPARHQRQAGNQAVGHAQFQQLVAGLGVQRLEGQHRQRHAGPRRGNARMLSAPPRQAAECGRRGACGCEQQPAAPAL